MSNRRRKQARPPHKKGPIPTTQGILRLHPRGFGFVIPDEGDLPDIFIPKHLTDNAIDGDRVEVAINPESKSEKGPDGKILSVLSRGRTHIAGIISHIHGVCHAHIPLLGASRPAVIENGEGLKLGERVILRVEEWGDAKTPTLCTYERSIGHIDDPSCDVTAATEEFGLLSSFPKAALKQALALGQKVSQKELQGRHDFSTLTTLTIDPETAKDFDDALAIEVDRKGHYHLSVHIADVAHYVHPGSALDEEAFRRGNSTYFPGSCIPMLPEELSNHLCSLREGVVRLTVSVLMEFDPSGTLVAHEICRGYIKSKKRLTYGQARKILEGKSASPHRKSLEAMKALCLLLKEKRAARGSIDFALPELVIFVSQTGEPTKTHIEEYDITHQMVEEFMLKANEIVATALAERGKELIYRIHAEPSKEDLQEFDAFARALGFALPPKPTQKDYQILFEKAAKTPQIALLSIGFIRKMKLAFYSPQNVGHFGLALEHYCHFTSPIRRYSDLVIERLLFDEEGKENLDKISKQCSEKERLSYRAEITVVLLKKQRLLKHWHEKHPHQPFAATVTKIKPFGIVFEMNKLFLEGFLHVSELTGDFYHYVPTQPALVGKSSGTTFHIGTEIFVLPKKIDLVHLEVEWELKRAKR